MSWNVLNAKVLQWANDRGLFSPAKPEKQCLKFISEAGEVADGVAKDNLDEIVDGVGDTLVTLILLSHMHGFSLEQALEHAYDTIKDRKGKTVGGVFIKEQS